MRRAALALLALLCLGDRALAAPPLPSELERSYDKFEDLTTISSPQEAIRDTAGKPHFLQMKIMSEIDCHGDTICTRDSVSVSIIRQGADWFFLLVPEHDLYMISRGRRLTVPNKLFHFMPGGRAMEVLFFRFPTAAFADLFSGDIDCKISGVRFALTPARNPALAAMARWVAAADSIEADTTSSERSGK